MRRAPAGIVVVGVVALLAGAPARATADDGFWVTIAAGAAGSSTPTDYSEFSFLSPHAPPVVVNELSSGLNVEAATAGGKTFFGNLGTPVLLPTGDGYATITPQGFSPPDGSLPRFAGGSQASGAPQTGPPPPGVNKLSAGLTGTSKGEQVLAVGLTDENGNPLGVGVVTVPDGGWWVIGVGPGNLTLPQDPTGGNGGGGDIDDPPPGTPFPTTGNNDNNPTTPEPASLLMVAVGGLGAAGWRRLRRR
jgi:hypothetical protein